VDIADVESAATTESMIPARKAQRHSIPRNGSLSSSK
jgi:hypothetical protein